MPENNNMATVNQLGGAGKTTTMSNFTNIIAIVNQKGGVGKTTTTANLGFALAEEGYKVLLIDFDPQTSLSAYMNKPENEYNIYSLLCKNLNDPNYLPEGLDDFTFDELIEKSIVVPTYRTVEPGKDETGKRVPIQTFVPFNENLELIPGTLELADFELYLIGSRIKRNLLIYQLTEVLNRISKVKSYDYILIDGGPSLGILTLNAITAATGGILIPTNLDVMSTRGVRNLINTIGQIQFGVIKDSNGTILHYGVIGVILNLFRESRTVDVMIQNDLERYYPFKIFKSTIPESTSAKKAVLGGLIYSQTYGKARDAYRKLSKELLKQMSSMKEEGPVVRELGEEFTYSVEDILNEGDNENE